MDVRAKLNENPKLTITVTLVAVAVVVSYVIWNFVANNSTSLGASQAYFTTNDALTGDAAVNALFVDSNSKAAPFDHNGKPAYRAYVFTCDDGKTKFIAYLERFTEAAKKKIDAAQAKLKPNDPSASAILSVHQNSTEVKKPGLGEWVKVTDPQADSITAVICPNGGNNQILRQSCHNAGFAAGGRRQSVVWRYPIG